MSKYIPVEPEKWAEMVKAMAEVTRLKAEVERLQNNCDYLDRELDREIDKTAMLCGQVERLDQQVKYWRIEAETDHARWLRVLEDVERLRKAGDAVCESPYLWENDPAVIAWRAAKEGKQP